MGGVDGGDDFGRFFFPREGGVEAATFSLTTSHICVGWQQMTGVGWYVVVGDVGCR